MSKDVKILNVLDHYSDSQKRMRLEDEVFDDVKKLNEHVQVVTTEQDKQRQREDRVMRALRKERYLKTINQFWKFSGDFSGHLKRLNEDLSADKIDDIQIDVSLVQKALNQILEKHAELTNVLKEL